MVIVYSHVSRQRGLPNKEAPNVFGKSQEMAKNLTKKQQVFVAEYLVDCNATRAAVAAGYSAKTAGDQASQLLSNPKIAAEVGQKLGKKLGKLDISAEKVLNEIGRCAFLDPRLFYRPDGTLIPVVELPAEVAAALGGMEIEEAYEHFGRGQAKPKGQLKKIKFADKLRALELLAKYHKLLTDRVEVSGLEGLAERLQKARSRAQQ